MSTPRAAPPMQAVGGSWEAEDDALAATVGRNAPVGQTWEVIMVDNCLSAGRSTQSRYALAAARCVIVGEARTTG